jgi:hypothetical protein
MPIPSRSPGGKPVTRALIAALEESAPGANVPNLRRIVDNLIGKAIDGDLRHLGNLRSHRRQGAHGRRRRQRQRQRRRAHEGGV